MFAFHWLINSVFYSERMHRHGPAWMTTLCAKFQYNESREYSRICKRHGSSFQGLLITHSHKYTVLWKSTTHGRSWPGLLPDPTALFQNCSSGVHAQTLYSVQARTLTSGMAWKPPARLQHPNDGVENLVHPSLTASCLPVVPAAGHSRSTPHCQPAACLSRWQPGPHGMSC